MPDLVLGIVCAFVASTFYSLGVAFQATEARNAPARYYLRPTLLRGLMRRARWLFGIGLSMLGWPLQVLALIFAPLIVVQPALATGLLVLVLAAERMLHERAGRREHIAMAAIILSVVGIALSAPTHSSVHAHVLVLTIVLAVLAAIAITPYLLLALGRASATITMLGAGLGFAWSGIATKLAEDDLHSGHLLPAALWALSTAAASVVGALSETSALQARPAIQVAPVVFVTQTVVPVAVAPLLLGERFPTTFSAGAPLAFSLAVLVIAAAALARSPLLLALVEGESPELLTAASAEKPTPCNPACASQESKRTTPATPEAVTGGDSTTTMSPESGRCAGNGPLARHRSAP
jgi:drug/metabolite transporter (DMT)-like permease